MKKKYQQVPEELKGLPRWVGFFRESLANGQTSKKPINPHTLYGADSTNPQSWGTFDEAVACIGMPCLAGGKSGVVEGIGFVLSPPYCGIDMDHVKNEQTGTLHPQAQGIINRMDSYTEWSPSGTGVHIIYKGQIHPDWKKKMSGAFGEHTALEMYQQGRYFTVTGDSFGGKTVIKENDAAAAQIQRQFTGKAEKPPKNHVRGALRTSLLDEELLDKARNSQNGLLFSELYAGHWQGRYGSQSEADLALCSMLAFWFGCDVGRMDAAFRRSGLMRDKWDRTQSGSTYGVITLQKAIDGCTETYTPSPPPDDTYSIIITQVEAPKKMYTLDDTGNAQRLFDAFGDRIRYNYVDRSWMIFVKNKWEYDQTGTIWSLIDKTIERMKGEALLYEKSDAENGTDLLKAFEKHLKKSRNNNAKKALEKEAQHYATLTPQALDRQKMLLNTPDGMINLCTFERKPSDPTAYCTKSTTVGWNEGADCPLWRQFLREIFHDDEALIRYVQKALGYSLTGLTDEQCAFFCYGTGKNGKSTFLDIIRTIFGDYASNIQPETIMVKGNAGAVNSDIARLRGARMVTSVEPNEGLRLNEGLLKQLTGNDMVTARRLYCEEFEFKPEFKLWMATNHKPVIRGTDPGIWRRIHLIPFTVQIPEEKTDRKLKDKLMQEVEGIMDWCLQGLRLYHAEGLMMPPAVAQAVQEYRTEMDIIAKFLDECTTPAPMKCVRAKDLYNVYVRWCEENGEYKMTNTRFGTEVQKHYPKRRLNSCIVYSGVDFSDECKPYSISVKE